MSLNRWSYLARKNHRPLRLHKIQEAELLESLQVIVYSSFFKESLLLRTNKCLIYSTTSGSSTLFFLQADLSTSFLITPIKQRIKKRRSAILPHPKQAHDRSYQLPHPSHPHALCGSCSNRSTSPIDETNNALMGPVFSTAAIRGLAICD